MTRALQIKLLAAILAVIGIIAALLVRGSRSIPLTQQDRQLQQKLAQKTQSSKRHYVVP